MTQKQQRFVDHYLVDLNATQAAIRAGYSQRTAAEIGHENLRKPQIQAAIEATQAEHARRLEITTDRILRELARIAFADMREFAAVSGGGIRLRDSASWTDHDAAAVAELVETGGGVRVKLHNKLAALDMLAKRFGLYAPDKLQVASGLAITTQEARMRIEAAIERIIANKKRPRAVANGG